MRPRPSAGTSSSIRLDARVKAKQGVSWSQARSLIETGKVFLDGRCIRDCAHEVSPEADFEIRMNAPRTPDSAAPPNRDSSQTYRRVFEDPHLLVVDKPSGISSVPFERAGGSQDRDRRSGRKNDAEEVTLQGLLEEELRQKLHVVQRLDRETSGLIVFARTADAARGLAQQFRFHTIHRRYVAVVHGWVAAKLRESSAIQTPIARDRGDGLRGLPLPGVRVSREDLQAAVTHVRLLGAIGEGERAMSLIECRLETGRTHQIRIHLSEAGHPLLGDRAYQRDFRGTPIPADRILLHAAELGLRHPVKEGLELRWRSPLPGDFHLDFSWAAASGIEPGWFRDFIPESGSEGS